MHQLHFASTSAQPAQRLLQSQWQYAQRGLSLATAALAGASRFVEWQHYPKNDCIDAQHGTRFFYHAHAGVERAPDEHGHFHVFSRAAQVQQGFAHLIGISLNAKGNATRLFTTNQWVTGESWVPAAELVADLPGFALQTRGRLVPVAQWIVAIVQCYAPLIETLLAERDQRVSDYAMAQGLDLVRAKQDQRLHIISQRSIDPLEDIAPLLGAATLGGSHNH